MNQKANFLSQSLLLLAVAVAVPVCVYAAPEVVPVEGVSFNVNASMADNLRALHGRHVTLMIESGGSVSGVVGEVGEHLLHLEKLERKEYFDAAVRIDAIRSVETRFREIKR